MSQKLTGKRRKEIAQISVFDDVIRERETVHLNTIPHCWIDNPPDEWDERQTEIFDLGMEIEQRFKEKLEQVLNS